MINMAPDGEVFDVLFERTALPSLTLPALATRIYGSAFGLSAPCLIANFVSSIDGVVALDTAEESGHIVSGNSTADRFTMGLLRACADAIVVGAGTFRKSRAQNWDAEAIYPEGASLFTETRAALGLSPRPKLVVVTGAATIDDDAPALPALREAIVMTTPHGAAKLRATNPSLTNIVAWEGPRVPLDGVLAHLRQAGLRTVLTEGGPTMLSQFVAEGLLDELFVTVSPTLFGRTLGDGRKSLAEGVDLAGTETELRSIRRHRSHLFLRYAIGRQK